MWVYHAAASISRSDRSIPLVENGKRWVGRGKWSGNKTHTWAVHKPISILPQTFIAFRLIHVLFMHWKHDVQALTYQGWRICCNMLSIQCSGLLPICLQHVSDRVDIVFICQSLTKFTSQKPDLVSIRWCSLCVEKEINLLESHWSEVIWYGQIAKDALKPL